MSNETTKTKRPVNTPTRVIKELFGYYRDREIRLVDALYKKGLKGYEIANILEVDPAAVARRFPSPKGYAK